MTYWSKHPMGGDLPLDALVYLEEKYLLKELERRELNKDECFFELPYEERKSLYEKHKYELLNGFHNYINKTRYFEYEFVLVFKFIDYDIRVPNQYIDKLIEMLGDGGAFKRGYSPNEEDSPYAYVKIVIDNKESIFSENKSIKDVPQDVAERIYSPGLLQTIFEKTNEGYTGLINAD